MNKKSIFASFLTLGIVLSGCGKTISSSSDTSTPATTSSTPSSSSYVPDGHFDMWTKEQQELIKKYCGEVLPFPDGLIEGEVVVEEITQYDDDLNEYYYLEIRNESNSFTLEDYYMFLEEFDWNPISDYLGNIIQTSNEGVEFAECTKASKDKTEGYDLLYMYLEEHVDSEDNVIPAANVIRCYNDLCGAATTSTAWNEDELEAIDYALTTEIPFINLGSLNQVGLVNANTLLLRDIYAVDLTSDYVELLKEDGYTINTKLSKQYDTYILEKTLSDGAIITAQLYYFAGNYIYFYYTPKVHSYTAWPTDIMDEIKEKSGVTIPSFDVAENGTYTAYKKHDTYYVYTYDLDLLFDYEEYALNQLQFIDLSWEETISFSATDLYDEDYENIIGFLIVIELKTPTSTFVSTYPNEKVNEVIKDLLGVTNVTLPEFTNFELPRSDKKVKYEIYGQDVYEYYFEYYYQDILEYPFFYDLPDEPTEEDIKALAKSLAEVELGIKISIYDVDFKAYEAYESILYNAGWYVYYDLYGYTVYEDPTGAIAVTFTGSSEPTHNDEGLTTFFIHKGTGEAHEALFTFDEEEVTMAAGQNKDLTMTIKMLPYDVTFSSDNDSITVDSKGSVTVKEGTAAGTTATITSTMNIPGESKPLTATCTIIVADAVFYTPKSAIDAVAALVREAGYEPNVTYYDETNPDSEVDNLVINFGTSLTEDDVKTLVTSSLALKGFEALIEDGEDDEDDWGDEDWSLTVRTASDEVKDIWKDGSIYIGEDEYPCKFLDYQLNNEYCYIIVEYFIYQVDGNLFLKVMAY